MALVPYAQTPPVQMATGGQPASGVVDLMGQGLDMLVQARHKRRLEKVFAEGDKNGWTKADYQRLARINPELAGHFFELQTAMNQEDRVSQDRQLKMAHESIEMLGGLSGAMLELPPEARQDYFVQHVQGLLQNDATKAFGQDIARRFVGEDGQFDGADETLMANLYLAMDGDELVKLIEARKRNQDDNMARVDIAEIEADMRKSIAKMDADKETAWPQKKPCRARQGSGSVSQGARP